MVMTGLNLNAQLGYEVSLAQGTFEDAYKKSPDLKAYIKALNTAVKLFTTALADENVLILFELEKTAQEFDLGRTNAVEKRIDSLTALETMKKAWKNMQDPIFVREHYANAHSNVAQPQKIVRDTSMDNDIQSQCRKLGVLASGLAIPAEKAFYLKRQECLKFIGKEHNKRINEYLGLGKSRILSPPTV